MIPVLAIPTLNRLDMLERCIRSIDHDVALLVVIDNSGGLTQYRREWFSEKIQKSQFIGHPNAGVAASWNEAIKLFPADYWLLCNDDVQFTPGALAKFDTAMEEAKLHCVAMMTNVGASCFAVTVRGVERVGLFDENFFPAYMEDVDWFHRAKLLKEPILQAKDVRVIHGENGAGSQTIKASPGMQRENKRTFAQLCDYYRQKWGGESRFETFNTPFNIPGCALDYWKFSTELRKVNQWKV